jgi:hypothetical protein
MTQGNLASHYKHISFIMFSVITLSNFMQGNESFAAHFAAVSTLIAVRPKCTIWHVLLPTRDNYTRAN